MERYTFDSLSEAIENLRVRGYMEDFILKSFCLTCSRLNLELRPEQFTIDETYRFEGMSNPDDSSVIYAVSSNQQI